MEETVFPSIADEKTRQQAREVLAAGGVVVLPTDTLYGLSAAVSSGQAVRRIAAIKGAANRTQFLLLADSVGMVETFVRSFGCVDRARLERIWPAPVTVILPAGDRCPAWLGETVAFRVPDHAMLRDIIRHLGEPIVSTSINRTGESPMLDLGKIGDRFGDLVDLVVAGDVNSELASTIVDLTGESPEVVRRGDYEWEDTD
jgi:tRNA threonylcarbamoyl adenosine modification protein (Sua5/YciO/YrdC/YwlC family)